MMTPKKPFVAIIDYHMSNLFSVERACRFVGMEPCITSEPEIVRRSDAVILPGVGAFGNAMDNLRSDGLIEPIKESIANGKPFMGVCLGMQLLMTESEEFGHHEGLDIMHGTVVKFPQRTEQGHRMKIPQIGWNTIFSVGENDAAWNGTPLFSLHSGTYMYFVHSYYVQPQDASVVLSKTLYAGTEYCSSFRKDNIFAAQFHPEKSGPEGIRIYQNFCVSITKQQP